MTGYLHMQLSMDRHESGESLLSNTHYTQTTGHSTETCIITPYCT